MTEYDQVNPTGDTSPAYQTGAPHLVEDLLDNRAFDGLAGGRLPVEHLPPNNHRGAVLFLVAVAFGVAGLFAWRMRGDLRSIESPIASTTRGSDSGPRIFAGGIVEGGNRELLLRFEIPGKVKAVLAHQGDSVKAGDVLAELESGVADLNLAEARLRLKIAMAEHTQSIADSRQLARDVARTRLSSAEKRSREAEALLERSQNAGRKEVATRRELQQRSDRAIVQLQGLRTQTDSPESTLSREEEIILDGKVSLAEVAVRRERLFLEKHRLRAPVDGRVLRVSFEPGELTGPTDEGALLTLANLDAVHVRAFVEELDSLRVKPGQQAAVSVAGNRARTYAGTVRTCSPDVRPKSHRHLKAGERLDVRVREVLVQLEDGSDLLIGLPVEVYIEIQ